MPDGHIIPLGSYRTREQAALLAGERQTRADLISDAKERAIGLMDELDDAFDEIEREAPGSMRIARLHLVDARSEVEGTK